MGIDVRAVKEDRLRQIKNDMKIASINKMWMKYYLLRDEMVQLEKSLKEE